MDQNQTLQNWAPHTSQYLDITLVIEHEKQTNKTWAQLTFWSEAHDRQKPATGGRGMPDYVTH